MEIEKISKILAKEGLSISKADKKLYNYEIIVNSKSEQVKVLVYFGKKELNQFFREIQRQKSIKQ